MRLAARSISPASPPPVARSARSALRCRVNALARRTGIISVAASFCRIHVSREAVERTFALGIRVVRVSDRIVVLRDRSKVGELAGGTSEQAVYHLIAAGT